MSSEQSRRPAESGGTAMRPPMREAEAPPAPARPAQRHVLRPASEYSPEEETARTIIPKDMIHKLETEGFSLQWVTNKIYGQPQPQHRMRFERRGWVPVHQEDFDGRFRGMRMPVDYEGEIEVDGLVLMARPKAWNDKAKGLDVVRAYERVAIKERQVRGGDLPGVTLDAAHPSALRFNTIARGLDTVSIPVPGKE